jgi:hypothetical protein
MPFPLSGDLSATSTAGRAVACVLLMMGVLGLAVPLGVIGSELDRAYTKHFVRSVHYLHLILPLLLYVRRHAHSTYSMGWIIMLLFFLCLG